MLGVQVQKAHDQSALGPDTDTALYYMPENGKI
jgi:hypothetical protein